MERAEIGEDCELNVFMFGQFQVISKNGLLDEEMIRSEMVTKLLTYFFCNRRKKITIQELSDALWNDDSSDNPAGALKNLMYRLRNLMKKEWGDQNFIITGRGTYYWNPDLKMNCDWETFETYCRKARRESLDEAKISLYKKAVSLYKGMFLPKMTGEYWIASLSTYYHSLYLTTVKELAGLLEERNSYEEMGIICSRAIHLDALDEELHGYFIKALIGQNKQNLAIEHYQKAIDLLYENLGIRPSEELRQVYDELLKQKNEQELDLSTIQRELKADDDGEGAFLCEYGVFKKSYHLEIRRTSRLGLSIYVSLITIYPSIELNRESEKYLQIINSGMDIMQCVLLTSLRTGDVISRYSGNQFIVMLPSCQNDTANKIMDRIQSNFYSIDKTSYVKLQYSLEEIDFSEDSKEK